MPTATFALIMFMALSAALLVNHILQIGTFQFQGFPCRVQLHLSGRNFLRIIKIPHRQLDLA